LIAFRSEEEKKGNRTETKNMMTENDEELHLAC